jgi:hypothetical protein
MLMLWKEMEDVLMWKEMEKGKEWKEMMLLLMGMGVLLLMEMEAVFMDGVCVVELMWVRMSREG